MPRQTTDGIVGEEGWFALELRTIADAGLVRLSERRKEHPAG